MKAFGVSKTVDQGDGCGRRGLRLTFLRRAFLVLAMALLCSALLYGMHTLSIGIEMNRQLSDQVWRRAIAASSAGVVAAVELEDLEQLIESQEDDVELKLAPQGSRIRNQHRKKILWAGGHRKMQPWSIVYIHGFSAGPLELEPAVSRFAERLGANLYLTRLSAHGLTDGEAFASVKATDWVRDVVDAVAVGRAIGRNVLLMGTSTGAALALRYVDAIHSAAAEGATSATVEGATSATARGGAGNDSVKALIMLSPNYRVQALSADLLGNKLGRSLAQVLVGRHREFSPENELHKSRWTTKYRSEALHELILVTLSARRISVETLKIPVLTVYTQKDEVVSVDEIEKRTQRFHHPDSLTVNWVEGSRHELASATFDSEKVDDLVSLLSNWVSKLEIGARKNQNESSH